MTKEKKRIISLLLRAERRAKERDFTMIYINGIPALQLHDCYKMQFSSRAVRMWDSKNSDFAAYIPFRLIKEIDLFNRIVIVNRGE